ncbi:MAG: Rod shape-determining protein MreC [uncultured Rubrobacteraceae bacterium]|uniref:Cell shape-determining protein MreC n=1 Tax=uncultured Rubrobacteraceae bacterium TaxID=349277 RepID=A0A6J4QY01_9ACTN|nr:MAG: Rod shape-determining protein MreC [uncultured Rubrobacteraceae bacterium]
MGRRKPNAATGLAALAILCVTSLALFTIYVKEGESGPLHTVQLGAAEVLRPVRGLFGFAASPIETAGERVEGVFDASEKEELEEKARKNEEGAAEAARLRQENERLRRLLEGQQPSFEYSSLAQVVAPVGGQLSNRIQINVGTDDGVKPEQPVVVGNNTLVGRTTDKVTANTAEVILVTDQNFAAGVRLLSPEGPDDQSGEETTPADGSAAEEPHGEGLLKTGWDDYLGVDYVDLDAGAEQGDFVVTSGRAGDRELLFPPGLLVGTVESVSSQDINQYKNIVVSPAVKAAELEEVRVITDW